MIAITLIGNMPLNLRVMGADENTDFEAWRGWRRRWDQLHYLRVVLDLSAFAESARQQARRCHRTSNRQLDRTGRGLVVVLALWRPWQIAPRTQCSGVRGYISAIAVQQLPPEVLERFRLKERFDCWNRGEFDLMQEPYAEDAVFDVSRVFRDTPPMRGHAAMRRYWHELRETWKGLRIDPLDVLRVGENHYVVDLRLWGQGRASGAAADQRFAFLYTTRADDGKVVEARLFQSAAEAISAAESTAPA